MSETPSSFKRSPKRRGVVTNEVEVMVARMSLLKTLIAAAEEKTLNSKQKVRRDKHIWEKAQIETKLRAFDNGKQSSQTSSAIPGSVDGRQPHAKDSLEVVSIHNLTLRPAKVPAFPPDAQEKDVAGQSLHNTPRGPLYSIPYRPHQQPVSPQASLVSHPSQPAKVKQRVRNPIVPPSRASGGVPEPSQIYLALSTTESRLSSVPQHLLLVIDLNGTLLYRPNRNEPYHFIERPSTKQFLTYALTHFSVMIWSSAKPTNVERMCNKLLSEEDRRRLLAVWGRDRLGLTTADSQKRVQVYKRLETVWNDPKIQGRHPLASEGKGWHQGNTLLIDDSVEKSRSEPYNFLEVPEFAGHKGEDPNILKDLAEYLAILRMQTNVSSYVFQHPLVRQTPLKKQEEASLTTVVNKQLSIDNSARWPKIPNVSSRPETHENSAPDRLSQNEYVNPGAS